jgi:hypothetical protein
LQGMPAGAPQTPHTSRATLRTAGSAGAGVVVAELSSPSATTSRKALLPERVGVGSLTGFPSGDEVLIRPGPAERGPGLAIGQNEGALTGA